MYLLNQPGGTVKVYHNAHNISSSLVTKLVRNFANLFSKSNTFSEVGLKNLILNMSSNAELECLVALIDLKIRTVNDGDMKRSLTRQRQRAYKHRKRLKVAGEEITKSQDNPILKDPSNCESKKYQGFFLGIDRMQVIFFAVLSMLGAIFVFLQTAYLRSGLKFEQTNLTTWITIGLGAFVSATHLIKKNHAAAIICMILIISDGIFERERENQQERELAKISIELKCNITLTKANVTKSKMKYQRMLSRYDNPKCKVFRCPYFKSKYLDPAWEKYSQEENHYQILMGLDSQLDTIVAKHHLNRQSAVKVIVQDYLIRYGKLL